MLTRTFTTVQNNTATPTPAMAPPLVFSRRARAKPENSRGDFGLVLQLFEELCLEHFLQAESFGNAEPQGDHGHQRQQRVKRHSRRA